MDDVDEIKNKLQQLETAIASLVGGIASGGESQWDAGLMSMADQTTPTVIGGGGDPNPACYDMTVSNVQNATAALSFENRYYRCGGKTYEGSTASAQGVSLPCIVALRIDLTGSAPTDTITSYTDLAALKAAEEDTNYFTFPLYKLDATGGIVCDFRIGLNASIGEF